MFHWCFVFYLRLVGAYGRVRAIDHSLKRCKVSNSKSIHPTRDGRPVPRGTLPAGKGGFPAPPRAVGRGGFPAPPRPVKMIKTAGKLRGKIKARISTFSNRGNQ